MAEEALDLYYSAVARKVEGMPEFQSLCSKEMEEVLSSFPSEVREHVMKMRASSAFEYINWISSRTVKE